MNPRISVVLPTHNRARLLPRAIGGVLAQTLRDLELIVVDDGSTDDTRDVLASIGDPRLRVIHRKSGGGAAAARNAGLAVARGTRVAFMDDDDYWLVQKLERQLAELERSGASWCVTGYLRLDREFKYIGGKAYALPDYGHGMAGDWSLVATPGWLVARELLDRAGPFDERIRSWDDWELGLRLAAIGGRPRLVDEPLWVQDWLQGSGLIRAERQRARDMRLIMEKHGAMWASQRDVLALHWYMIGRAESLYDPAPSGRPALRESLRLNPKRPMTWAALVMSYLGQPLTSRLTRRLRELKGRLA